MSVGGSVRDGSSEATAPAALGSGLAAGAIARKSAPTCGGTTVGKKGMALAARTLAATAYDLFADPKLVAAGKAEFTRRLSGRAYAPMIDKDQKPPLDYRDSKRKGGE